MDFLNPIRNVLFITHVGSPGGAEFKMINLIGTIRNPSFVLMFQKGGLENTLKEKKIKNCVIEMPIELKSFKRDTGIIGIARVMWFVLKFIRKVSLFSKNYDIIVCMSQKAFLISSLAKPFVRKPIIWFMNDLLSEEHFSKVLIKILVLVSRFSADHIILNSQASYEAWIKSGGRRKNVSIIYSAIDIETFDKNASDLRTVLKYKELYNPNNKILIGHFGRLCPWKGQEIFIRALALIKGANGVIVGGCQFGEEEYEAYLKNLCEKLGVQDRIFFTGHQDDIPQIMNACDIIVHTSTSPEPFGRVIVEGMASKKPVIASDAGGAQEIIQHNITGQLTAMGDVGALCAAICRYIDNPDWAKSIAENARKKAIEKFSNSAVEKQFPLIINRY